MRGCVLALLAWSVAGCTCSRGASVETDRTIGLQIKAWAGPGGTVEPYDPGPLGGLQVFRVTRGSQGGQAGRVLGAVVPPRSHGWLIGKDAMRAILARSSGDPMQLARLAALVLGSGADVVSRPEQAPDHAPPAEKERVEPPALREGLLEFWVSCCPGDRAPPRLGRCRLTLSDLSFQRTDASYVLELERAASAATKAPGPTGGAKTPSAPAPVGTR